MKIIKNNKGAIIFYLIIIVTGLLLKVSNDNYIMDKESNNTFTYNDSLN